MEQIILQHLGNDAAPRATEESMYPNIDSSYTVRSYTGERIAIRDNHTYGIKPWGANMYTQMQGLAIYGDMLIRTRGTGYSHKIYRIGTSGNLTELATFNFNLGHANALQFAPNVEDGQVFPYLYVVGLGSYCYVLSISSSYEVTLVQTITIQDAGQILRGDDGFIWTSASNADATRRFTKYRQVSVSEGDVTLTDADIVDTFNSVEAMPSATYTAQGWKVKQGKIWYCYGANGSGQNRGVKIYDTASHRLITTIDLSDYTTLEFEDVELYDNGLVIATYAADMYMLRF